jgi:hypothetical protein
MKMVASRELAASPAKAWQLLENEGYVVITKDGKPRGILLPTSEDTLLEDLEAQIGNRARRAVTQIRQRAAKAGPPTSAAIDKEIMETRGKRYK